MSIPYIPGRPNYYEVCSKCGHLGFEMDQYGFDRNGWEVFTSKDKEITL